jgi:hypothetical protein
MLKGPALGHLGQPPRMVDKGVAVALAFEDGGVTVTLPDGDRVLVVPGEQHRPPSRASSRGRSIPGNAAEVEDGAGSSTLTVDGLEASRSALAAIITGRILAPDLMTLGFTGKSENSVKGVLPRKLLHRDSQANKWCRAPRMGSSSANQLCGTTCSQLNGSSAASRDSIAAGRSRRSWSPASAGPCGSAAPPSRPGSALRAGRSPRHTGCGACRRARGTPRDRLRRRLILRLLGMRGPNQVPQTLQPHPLVVGVGCGTVGLGVVAHTFAGNRGRRHRRTQIATHRARCRSTSSIPIGHPPDLSEAQRARQRLDSHGPPNKTSNDGRGECRAWFAGCRARLRHGVAHGLARPVTFSASPMENPSRASVAPNNHQSACRHERGKMMWDTAQTNNVHMSHDMQCPRCGHDLHTFLACDTDCACEPVVMPGEWRHPPPQEPSSAPSVSWHGHR